MTAELESHANNLGSQYNEASNMKHSWPTQVLPHCHKINPTPDVLPRHFFFALEARIRGKKEIPSQDIALSIEAVCIE